MGSRNTRIRDIIDKALGGKSKDTKADDTTQHQSEEYPGIDVADPILLSKPQVSLAVNKYLSLGLPADFEKRMEKYKHLPNFTGYETEREDFPDYELVNEPAIILCEITDIECCTLGKYLFTELSVGVSRADLGILFLLAFQLKVPGKKKSTGRVFPKTVSSVFNTTKDVSYDQLESQQITTSQSRVPFVESGNISEDAKSYAFLAASMLRMFTRAPENFLKAWSRIQNGYGSFYIDPLAVTGISLNIKVLRTIHRYFSIDPLMKATLFRILYHTNSTDDYASIKNFLYKFHLCYTGMHILPIFVRLCSELKCSSGLILGMLEGGEFDKQIESLNKLLRFAIDSNVTRRKKMWIYGRIFDQNFMSSLQTRHCPRFVYILASALKKENPRENAGVLNIVQLQDLSADNKQRCEYAADRLIVLVRRAVNQGQD